MGVGVDEDLSLSVQPEPLFLAEEDRLVAITDRDQIILPVGVILTALGLELELHGEAEALLHLHVVLSTAGWLGGEGVRTVVDTCGPVYWHQGEVYRRLLAASTALQ